MHDPYPLRLYDYRFSGNSYKVRLALHQLCLKVETVPVDILAGDSNLMPTSLQDQAHALQWMFFEQSNIDQVLGRTRFLRAFPDFRTPAPQEWQEWYRAGNKALSILDSHLGDREYLVGSSYSIADIALYGYVHTANEGGFELADFTNIGRWLRNVETTDGYIPQLEGEYP